MSNLNQPSRAFSKSLAAPPVAPYTLFAPYLKLNSGNESIMACMDGQPCDAGQSQGTIQSVIHMQNQGQRICNPRLSPLKLYLPFYLLDLPFCLQVPVPVSHFRHQINLKEGPFSYALSGKDKVKMMFPPKLHLLLSLLALQFCLQMPVLVFLARYQVPLHQSICLL